MGLTAAVIGSFKQHNNKIQDVCSLLRKASVTVTSPVGCDIIAEGVEFVRYESDDPTITDHEVQSIAMHRIFNTDFVYVVAPAGYIGRTTCYEIGRIIQARHPLYFSERPLDLPIQIPVEFIKTPTELLELVNNPKWVPSWLFENALNSAAELERELSCAKLRT